MPGEIQPRSYKPSRPVGERCGHAQIQHDGRPANRWDVRSVPEFHAEMTKLDTNDLDPALTYAEHLDYMAQAKNLMRKAMHGTVAFGDGKEGNVIRDVIVELKPRLQSDRPAFGRLPRLLRLYLAEPELSPQLLLGLCLATKAHGAGGLNEQDGHIDCAIARADRWAQSPTL